MAKIINANMAESKTRKEMEAKGYEFLTKVIAGSYEYGGIVKNDDGTKTIVWPKGVPEHFNGPFSDVQVKQGTALILDVYVKRPSVAGTVDAPQAALEQSARK